MDTQLLTRVLDLLPYGIIIWRLDRNTSNPKGTLRMVWSNTLAAEITGIGGEHKDKTIGRYMDHQASMKLHEISRNVILDGNSLVLERFKFGTMNGSPTVCKMHFQPIDKDHMVVVMDRKRTLLHAHADATSDAVRSLVSRLENGFEG